jgi:hypothetical protein
MPSHFLILIWRKKMPENLSYGIFPLLNEANTNETARPGQLYLEYFEVVATISSNAADVEIPTSLSSIKGVLNLCFMSIFATGDILNNMTTDGVITDGAVTVRIATTSIADGALTIRGFLVGDKKASTILLNS